MLDENELIKTNKKYLLSTNIYRRKILHLKNKIERYKYLTVNISSTPNICNVKKDRTNDRMAQIVEDIVDLENEIKATELELSTLQDTISFKISQIPNNDQQMILFYRYIDNLQFKAIAINMNYSQSNVYVIHRNALINFNKGNL